MGAQSRCCKKHNGKKDPKMSSFTSRLVYLCFFLLTFPCQAAAFQPVSSEPRYIEPERFRQESPYNNEAEELLQTVRKLAEELFLNLEDPDPQVGELSDGILVCTFVDINKLTRTSSFGRYVAGQLMNEFQRLSYPVIDMRKSVSVMVQEKRGEFGLSRDPEEIKASQSAGAMLTGTYFVGDREIIVHALILDNKSATMLAGATMVFPRNALGNMMLQDSASARTSPAEVVYMKRLEL